MGSPRPQSPRPSTSRDHSDRRDDRRRSRDSPPDRKDDRRKSRIPKRNSSPSSLVINKRTPKETQGENSTPEKTEEMICGEKDGIPASKERAAAVENLNTVQNGDVDKSKEG